MKTKQIIVRFLDLYQGTTIGSHALQTQLPTFAQNVYNKYVNPATVDREWRLLRGDSTYLEKNGYTITEDLDHRGREKRYIIRRLVNEIHRNSEGQTTEQGNDNSVNRSQSSHSGGAGVIP